MNRQVRQDREEKHFLLARRAKQKKPLQFFASFALLSERSERAVKLCG
jgi:hypothetical protein